MPNKVWKHGPIWERLEIKRDSRQRIKITENNGWQQLIGIIPIIPFALYFDLNNFGDIELKHVLIIFYGIFFSSAYTYWAYFTVLQKFSVNITSISVMTVPVLAVLIDYLMIDFPFSTLDLLALIFIISGIYIAATKPFSKK